MTLNQIESGYMYHSQTQEEIYVQI